METIKTIKVVTSKYNVKTTLGISNVSYGLPNRSLLTRTFLTMAMEAGLDSAIMDPLDTSIIETVFAAEVLLGYDIDGERYLESITGEVKREKTSYSLNDMIVKGDKEGLKAYTKEQLKVRTPLSIVDEELIPALDLVGKRYEKKELFLPQLIRAAETISVAFDVIKSQFDQKTTSKGKIIMATVYGDVHDIGKNLVKILLENYGYEVIDLGKDVPPEEVIKQVKEQNVKLVGLSALMTTTVGAMAKTISLLKDTDAQVFVGGAVLTESYAKSIGADYYCKDGQDSVKVAKTFFGGITQ
jgi:5-methyltetrahydrofolate--homocysteine methyltransferase